MSVPAPSVNNTTNYLVPAGGQTHAIQFTGQFSSVPYYIDWRQFKIDQFPFQPQGVFIDNTAGTTALVITIKPLGWRVVCPAGQQLEAQFPAPNGQTASITGDPANTAIVCFVDFPVLPSAATTQIVGTVNTVITGIGSTVMNANDNPLAAGNTLPYRTQEYVPTAEPHTGAITGAATTYTLTPTTAQQNLRRFRAYLTGDAAMAAAGENTITVTLNGATIFSRKFYLPNAAPAAPQPGITLAEIDADTFGLPAAAGNLVVTLATALSVGQVDIESYFTPQ